MHFDYEGHTGIAVLIVIHPCTRASGHVQAICACASLYLQEAFAAQTQSKHLFALATASIVKFL